MSTTQEHKRLIHVQDIGQLENLAQTSNTRYLLTDKHSDRTVTIRIFCPPAHIGPDGFWVGDGVTLDGNTIGDGAILHDHVDLGQRSIIGAQSRLRHGVQIGEGAKIGPNTTIGELCRIGPNSVIGAGAVIPAQSTTAPFAQINHNNDYYLTTGSGHRAALLSAKSSATHWAMAEWLPSLPTQHMHPSYLPHDLDSHESYYHWDSYRLARNLSGYPVSVILPHIHMGVRNNWFRPHDPHVSLFLETPQYQHPSNLPPAPNNLPPDPGNLPPK